VASSGLLPGGPAAPGYPPEGYRPDSGSGRQQQEPPRGHNPSPGRGGGKPPRPPKRGFIDYPRYGRSGWTRWWPSWKLISMVIGTFIISGIIAFSFAYASIKIPAPDQAALAQTTVIYYANGKDEIGRLSTQNRQDVQLAQVPQPVRDAVLAAEDHTFYTNKGVDPKSILRAAYADARGNSLQGGSTISQQYVKNVYNQRDRSYKRKFNEVFLAVKINQNFSKDQILERYLNTIYLGRGAYGIQAASQVYFGKDVKDLTVSQGAFLAGIINAPSLADPRGGADEKARALRRWGVVLDAMVKWGTLDPTTRATLKFPTTIVPKQQSTLKGQNGYLMTMAKQEAVTDLKKAGVPNVTEDSLNTGGYKIVTTFNKSLIAAGVKAVKEKLPKDHGAGLKIGMASIDPKTGAIRAIYGGPNFLTTQTNQATQGAAQGGSTFKAFGLIAALEDGVSLKTVYNSKSPMYFKGYPKPVSNFGNENLGYIDLIKATEESVNTVFVQLNRDVGQSKTYKAAIAAGIPKKTVDLGPNLVNVLGNANVHPVNLAGAYGTFADQGVRHDPYSIASISYVGTDKPIYTVPDSQTKGRRVFTADAVADLTYALQHVVSGSNGTARYVQNLNRPVAGKTGTSNDSLSAWFVGYTPQLVTAVAFHREKVVDGRIKVVKLGTIGGVTNVTGGSFPAQVWTQYMEAALDGKEKIDFPEPAWGGDQLHSAPVTAAPTPSATITPDPQATSTDQPQPTSTDQGQEPTPTDDPQPTFSDQPPDQQQETQPPDNVDVTTDPGNVEGQ
jgi:membrane peptidoglycan carboxypeptidase